MKKISYVFAITAFISFAFSNCKENTTKEQEVILPEISKQEEVVKNQNDCLQTMQEHLDAVAAKDIVKLEETITPFGTMQLILPGTPTTNTNAAFLDYHKEWFKMDNWTIENNIVNATIGDKLAMAVVDMTYKEEERDGKPYFNKMTVSYDLEKIDGKWYVIKDHASSVEKSTDIE